MYSGTDMAFLYEVIQKYETSGSSNVNGNSNGDNNNTTVAVANSMLLSIESRNVFYTTLTEACVAAIGGWLSGVVGLPVVVALAAVPFLVGAFVALFSLESIITSACTSTNSSSASSSSSTATTATANDSNNGSCRTTNNNTNTNNTTTTHGSGKTNKPNDEDIAETKNHGGSSNDNSSNNYHRSWRGQKRDVGKAAKRTFRFFDTSTKLQLQLLRDCVANIPKRLWTLFGIGVALNCGTFVASTALNPLLWETVGIPVGHFGTLHAGCGATSAVGALLAPSLRRWTCTRTRTQSWTTRSNDKNNNDNSTKILLLFMLGTSAVGYGLMALSTTLHGWTTTTATLTPIFHRNNNYYYSVSSIGCAILAALLLSLVRGLAWPVLGTAINASIESNESRATTLSLFSGAVKFGMVLAGMVLGLLFNNNQSTTTLDARDDTSSNSNDIEKGLLHGTILCGMTLASITVWLVGSGLPSKSNNSNDEKKNNNNKDSKSKSD